MSLLFQEYNTNRRHQKSQEFCYHPLGSHLSLILNQYLHAYTDMHIYVYVNVFVFIIYFPKEKNYISLKSISSNFI